MKRLPPFLKKYFWDVRFDKLDAEASPRYIIERIMEHGDGKAVSWMVRNFSRHEIIETLKKSRQLTPKSANFWASILEVNRERILCLSKDFRKIQRAIWPY